MPYVSRDGSGNISGVYANPQPGFATELLADNDATLLAFLKAAQPPVSLSYLQFRSLFTSAEQGAIIQAALSSHALLDWLLQAAGAGHIELTNPLVTAGLNTLVAAGLLTPTRMTAILANQPPP